MTVFEYLSVFISIIVGLAVANVLLGLSRILGQGQGTSIAHAVWIYWTLLFLTFFWWFSFDWRFQDNWTFGLFLWVVGYAMLMFVLASLVTPTTVPLDSNWGEAFFSRRRTFFSVSAAVIVVDTADTFVKGAANLAGIDVPALLANQGALLVVMGVLAFTNHRRLFTGLSIVVVVYSTVAILRFADVFGT
jgi:hypothetical protein